MPASPRTNRAIADTRTQTTTAAVSASSEGASDYVTDGVNLYRLVGEFDGGEGPVVGIEDCHSLEVVLLKVADFPPSGLRRVVPRA